jgi:hypothetical protein
MGGNTSIAVRFERDRLNIRISTRATNSEVEEILEYFYNANLVEKREITPNLFVRQYIELLNIMSVGGPIQTVKRNLKQLVLHFLGNLGRSGDAISINVSRYSHIRQQTPLFVFGTSQIASTSRGREHYYFKSPHFDVNLVKEYLSTINRE